MGVVLAATQIDLERVVALKFLRPRVLERPDHVARFAREARAAARLQSEHVTRVLDVGALDSGAAYIVMEYLEGEDLGSVLAKRGALPSAEAVGYVLEASEGLAEAHAWGIVHRDLKPANLFLAHRTNGRPIVKVLDFGLSKLSAGDENVTTSESSILGSPLYMSPEQLMSAHAADARSDIWSLGVVLYELLTGRPAFPADRMPKLLAAILHGREERLEALRADIPAGLRAVVHRCLEKAPAARFADVAQLARALAPFGLPSHQTSVDRISHLLDPVRTVTRSDKAPADGAPAAPELEPPAIRRTPVESLPGASQSVTLPSALPDSSRRGPRARAGAARGRWVGSLAGLGVVAALGVVALSRTTTTSRAVDPKTAPSQSAGGGGVDETVYASPLEDARALVTATGAPSATSVPALASERPASPKTAPEKGSTPPRPVVAPVPRPAASSAAASIAAPPSPSIDPLAKLKSF